MQIYEIKKKKNQDIFKK